MSAFVLPAPGGAVAAITASGLPALLLFCALLGLLVEKVIATNTSGAGHRRLSRVLDVGIGPLIATAVVLAATQLAIFLNRAA